MRWALEHGSDDPEIIRSLIYFIFAYKFGLAPEEVDRLDCVQVEEFITLLQKLAEEQKVGENELEREL